MDDFERFEISLEEVTEDVLGITKELKLEMEPDNMTELLQSHIKT